MNPNLSHKFVLQRLVGTTLLLLLGATITQSITVDPCEPLEPVRKGGAPFVVGIAYWPGGTLQDWGAPETGLNPCNATDRATLAAAGAHFATYSARVDRLSVLKTTFPEELALTARARAGAPLVVTAAAFRAGVRSDAAYVASGAPAATGGSGFVSTLSLMARFDKGDLKYLQFYNLTCNDCGGWRSARCLNGTSCTLPVSNCTCAGGAGVAGGSSTTTTNSSTTTNNSNSTTDSSGSGSSSTDAGASAAADPSASTPARRRRLQQASSSLSSFGACNYTQFSYCAASINLAFDGVDTAGAGFKTASQVRKLNSYSLVALFARGRDLFFDFKDRYDNSMTDYWGKFEAAQADVVAAYSGNAEAGRVTGAA